jgi:hypothetical protein
VLDRLRELPGVAAVEGRVTGDYRVAIEGSKQTVIAHFVSLTWPEEAQLNRTVIQSGRRVEPGSSDEIVLSATFAEACNRVPGSTLTAVINGRRAKLEVVGVAVSPEFVSVSEPRTGLPDPWHFGVAWMDGDALAKASGVVGGFNDVAIQLAVGADEHDAHRRHAARADRDDEGARLSHPRAHRPPPRVRSGDLRSRGRRRLGSRCGRDQEHLARLRALFTEESECASRRSSTTSSGSPPTWT